MASKEHWEVDPWNDREMWLKVVGQEQENHIETEFTACQFFDRVGHTDIYPKVPMRYGACLEIGAGVGRLLRYASKTYPFALGVDSSVSITAMSTRYLQEYHHCRVVLNDGLHLPFPDQYFSFVYSYTCFQHMETLETIQQNLREAYRVLLPGGICKVQTVCGDPDPTCGLYDGHVFPSAEAFAEEFTRVGFQVEEARVVDAWIWITARKEKLCANVS